MSNSEQGKPPTSAVNWNASTKRDVVERALSDGIKDPAQIIAWAAQYKVVLTVEDIDALKKEIG